MSFLSLGLVVLAALIHATWNLLAKRAAHAGVAFVFANNLIAMIAYAPWVAWVLPTEDMVWSGAAVGFILLSALVHLAYSLCLQRGYQVADLSVVYPVARGTGPMLASAGAFLLLGEDISAPGVAGLLLVVAGIALIATQGRFAAFRTAEAHRGVRWGMGTGALIATYTVVDGWAVKMLGVVPVVLDWLSNALRFFFLLPVVLRDPEGHRARMRGHWRLAIAVGLLSPASYILVLTALKMGAPLHVVAPTREMSMMAGALFGMIFLGEAVGRWRLAGCVLLIVGVVLLSG
ncbi:DMT family transporter [Sphingopyxis panaciterrulae]|uniref:Drug/metabolite transporter (DMT)-like permease n=1 Tax=Sphingopyxis panaciterrulae TaxID=462372 RepID=A0A7W9B9L4_9SPHN|nr:DMT family transporter [Sphingopyxis panaciterrulae]MBB5708725.1 drug/metabolite transporter (DMT)-like permease [Sphingopyxis panaciterrulae]